MLAYIAMFVYQVPKPFENGHSDYEVIVRLSIYIVNWGKCSCLLYLALAIRCIEAQVLPTKPFPPTYSLDPTYLHRYVPTTIVNTE
jgi:hypothetical protein